jgi:hypothetical protein
MVGKESAVDAIENFYDVETQREDFDMVLYALRQNCKFENVYTA